MDEMRDVVQIRPLGRYDATIGKKWLGLRLFEVTNQIEWIEKRLLSKNDFSRTILLPFLIRKILSSGNIVRENYSL